jgi:hypothetical protein
MIDFDTLVFGPVYGTFGEPAVLTVGSAVHQITVIDHTRGIAVEETGPIAVETIRPVVDVRRSELAQKGIVVADLIDAGLLFAGQTWRIKAPLELLRDELRLILIAVDPDEDEDLVTYRLTETGDRRITEAGDLRVLG